MSQRKKKSIQKKRPKIKKKVAQTSSTKYRKLLIAALVIVTTVAFLPMLESSFLNYDDDIYIMDNPFIRVPSLSTYKTLFSSFYLQQYAPLAMCIMSIEVMLFGANPVPLKLISILLHLLNAVLVFYLFKILLKNFDIAFITAVIFALHPLQVEAVAWQAASMKIGSYALFFLGSLICYARFLEQNERKFYWWSLLLFLCSCLCKEQAIILPLLLPLFDSLKKRSLLKTSILLEKIPFAIVAIIFAILTLFIAGEQQHTQLISSFSLPERALLSFSTLGKYLVHFLLPLDLSSYYTYPSQNALPLSTFFFVVVAAIYFTILYLANQKKSKILVFSMLFFLINLSLPLLSQVMSVREVMMADRYMYLPIVGLGACIGYGFHFLSDLNNQKQKWYAMVMTVIAVLCTVKTNAQVKTWKDSITVFTNAIQYGSRSNQANRYLATPYNNRGLAHRKTGNSQAAMDDFNQAIALDPNHAKSLLNRGNLHFANGQYQLAQSDFDRAVKADPNDAKIYSSKGALLATQQKFDLALKEIDQALKLNPYQKEALENRIKIYDSIDRKDQALIEIKAFLNLYPRDPNMIALRNSILSRK